MFSSASIKKLTHGFGFSQLQLGLIVALSFVPVYGVLSWHWNSFDLIFLYWLENIMIGGFTFLGFYLLTATFMQKLLISLFFTLHYGIFCFAHGTFIIDLFGGLAGLNHTGVLTVDEILQVIKRQQLHLAIAGLAFLNLFLFIKDVTQARGTNIQLKAWMNTPYRRIIIMHAFILGSGILLTQLNNPIAGLLVLVATKCLFDIVHFKKTSTITRATEA